MDVYDIHGEQQRLDNIVDNMTDARMQLHRTADLISATTNELTLDKVSRKMYQVDNYLYLVEGKIQDAMACVQQNANLLGDKSDDPPKEIPAPAKVNPPSILPKKPLKTGKTSGHQMSVNKDRNYEMEQ